MPKNFKTRPDDRRGNPPGVGGAPGTGAPPGRIFIGVADGRILRERWRKKHDVNADEMVRSLVADEATIVLLRPDERPHLVTRLTALADAEPDVLMAESLRSLAQQLC